MLHSPHSFKKCAAAVLFCGLMTVLSCSSADTSSIEPTTSTLSKDGTTPTSYSQADPVPSGDMTEIWRKMGFTTEQAECLNDKMKDLSTKIDPNDPTGSLAANQTLIQGLMDDCKINEATLKP
ncbi:unannotated protein [freshwater metagenome]|uniref:Unannotated protein n=1 Tax=freshwater metagenome TaxID=449393 RepID=A0A6J7M269_9ZZZZ|nr:hypothetical protein [Actinomycetota bacterium]